MANVRLDRIWTGDYAPITVTQGTTASIGLVEASWRQPMELVCADLQTALEAAFGAGWTVSRDASAGAITIEHNATPFTINFRPGFATYWGFLSSSYGPGLSFTSDTDVEYQIDGEKVGFLLNCQ